MKILFLIVAVGSMATFCHAQDKSLVESDTLKYNGHNFYKGQILTLAYGSGMNKSFAFVWVGSGFVVGGNAPASFGKVEAEVLKFQKGGGKNYLVVKVIGQPTKLTIDIEGAVDNLELKFK